MAYDKPCFAIVDVKMNGILCESNLEGVNQGDEHQWDFTFLDIPNF